MTDVLDQAAELLARMSRAEKAQRLQAVVRDLGDPFCTRRRSPQMSKIVSQAVVRDLGDAFPGIETTPAVSGGEPCIVRTRIPVRVLEQARRLGTSEAELLRSFPSLRAEDLVNAWAYARAYRDEIDGQIRENESA